MTRGRSADPGRAAWAALAACAVLLVGCASPSPAVTTAGRSSGHTDAPVSPGPTVAPTRGTAPPSPPPSGNPTGGRQFTALETLARLPVRGRAPMTGYDRDRFGAAWLDADRNGCDTRNDMLGRDLTNLVLRTGTGDCVVLQGDLADPYTAIDIHFFYGDGALVDIDHVVALGNAWVTGGSRWSINKRAAFANDPLNLLPVDASANRQKGDGDAATWLPANRGFRCAYVARQISVKAKYGLSVTAPEQIAMNRILTGCPSQPVPDDSGAPTEVDQNIADHSSPSTPRGGSGGGSVGDPGDVSYANCDAVRAAGAAPIHAGEPGYGSHLDGDGDGSACE